jgi:FixJ family two-component response regulator
MARLPRSVYIVDDDKEFSEAIARLLGAHGIRTLSAATISDFWRTVPLEPSSCVLADIMLRDETGLTIPALLAEHGQLVPLLFISATEDEETLAEAARLSGLPCLQKPVEEDVLIAALGVAMEHGDDGPHEGEG